MDDTLLKWFEKNRRDLPWRKEPRDPYHVWISEVMLQQTQVGTVINYFNRWITQFPHIRALAEASLDTVLKAWEGLGYYTRARNLHRAARVIVENHDGVLPRNAKELQRLPGIGPYTSAAIASLAFGENVISVDGNIRRVVSRLFTSEKEVTQREAETLLKPYYAPGRAGRMNEALMELGALYCSPKKPHCVLCPLLTFCGAFREGNPENFPKPKKRKVKPHVKRKGLLLFKDEYLLYLIRRPEEGMLGGLWGIPLLEGNEVLRDASVETTLQEVSQGYTHFRITVTPLVVRDGGKRDYGAETGRFFPLTEVRHLALSALDHKILNQVETYCKSRAEQKDVHQK